MREEIGEEERRRKEKYEGRLQVFHFNKFFILINFLFSL